MIGKTLWIALAMTLPAITPAWGHESQNNLKQIGLSTHAEGGQSPRAAARPQSQNNLKQMSLPAHSKAGQKVKARGKSKPKAKVTKVESLTIKQTTR